MGKSVCNRSKNFGSCRLYEAVLGNPSGKKKKFQYQQQWQFFSLLEKKTHLNHLGEPENVVVVSQSHKI